MLKAEDDIQNLKAENSQLNSNNQHSGQECGHLTEQVNQMELELTISQEKHRTCQKEVNMMLYHRRLNCNRKCSKLKKI